MILTGISYYDEDFDVSFDSAGGVETVFLSVRHAHLCFKDTYLDVTNHVSERAVRFFEGYLQNRLQDAVLQRAERSNDDFNSVGVV